MTSLLDINNQIQNIFSAYAKKESDIELISLSTSDGFPIYSHASPDIEGTFEEDKMAAAASTLQSVSNAVSKQILSHEFRMTLIETDDGNVIFVLLKLASKDYVLAMSAKSVMNIATLRLIVKRISKEICALEP